MPDEKDVVIQLAAHENMTPEQALTLCVREAQRGEVKDVLIISTTAEDRVCVRSSSMNRGEGNWLIDQAKLHTLTSDLEE